VPRFKIFFLGCCLAVLAGCAVQPEELGISQRQWDKYSLEKQQDILAKHEALVAAKDNEPSVVVKDSWLQISISDGLVMMPPFTARYKYMPVTFKIKNGKCKKVLLHNYQKTHAVKLTVCYKKKILFLDPSRYEMDKKDGSVRLYSSPLWKNGFTFIQTQ